MTRVHDGLRLLPHEDHIDPTGKEIKRAYGSYHETRPDTLLETDAAIRLGSLLCQSEDVSHQLDSGCIAMEAAYLTGDSSYLEDANQLLKKVGREAPDIDTRVRARLYRSFIPAFKEGLEGKIASPHFMMERMADVNRYFLKEKDRLHQEAPQLGAQIGLLYVLLGSAAKDDNREVFAWPSMPRQHQSQVKDTPFISTFDVATGQVLSPRLKFKVIPSINSGNLAVDLHTKYVLERSRRDPTVILIYGDVHLGNSRDNRYAINRVIADSDSVSRSVALELIAQNVREEISTEIIA